MKPTTVRIDPDVVAELDAEAEERDISRNRRIQQVIDRRHRYDDLLDEYNALESEYEQEEQQRKQAESDARRAERKRDEAQEERDEMKEERRKARKRVKELNHETTRLENKLTAANNRHDDIDELVEYVDEEKKLQRDRHLRQKVKEDAPIWKRWKWRIFGYDRGE